MEERTTKIRLQPIRIKSYAASALADAPEQVKKRQQGTGYTWAGNA